MYKVFSFTNTDEAAPYMDKKILRYIDEQLTDSFECFKAVSYTHLTDSGNPHCHIMLTMRPLDERGAWAAKSKKEYDLDENGERIRLPSGRYKTHKVDLTGWNDKGNALLWRKAWADISNAYLNAPEAGRVSTTAATPSAALTSCLPSTWA